MKTFKTLAVIAAAWLGSTAALAATVPVGTLIDGQVSGASSTLLGADAGYAPSTATTLSDGFGDIEFMTDDGAVGVDFFSNGLLQIWNNTGTASLAGTYTFTFSFAALGQPIASFVGLDLGEVSGGSVGFQVVDPHTVSLTLTNLSFTSDAFPSFTAQLNVATVPEPGSLALMGAGLGLLALRRSKRAAA